MLTEIALTPQVFSKGGKEATAWRGSLEFLGAFLANDAICSVLCVSGLDAVPGYCGWEFCTAAMIMQIKDEPTRLLAQKVFEQLNKLLVNRDAGDPPSPESENDWLKEACRSHKVDFPIDQIICSESTECPCDIPIVGILSLVGSECLSDCSQAKSVEGPFNDQIDMLRPVIRHSQFLDLVLPRVNELYDGAVEAIVKLAADLPSFGGKSRKIAIHTEMSSAGDPNSVIAEATRKLSLDNYNLEVLVYPRQEGSLGIERRLIGGRLGQNNGSKARIRGARWGVHFSHLPKLGERKGRDEYRTWSVLDSREAQRSLTRLYHRSL